MEPTACFFDIGLPYTSGGVGKSDGGPPPCLSASLHYSYPPSLSPPRHRCSSCFPAIFTSFPAPGVSHHDSARRLPIGAQTFAQYYVLVMSSAEYIIYIPASQSQRLGNRPSRFSLINSFENLAIKVKTLSVSIVAPCRPPPSINESSVPEPKLNLTHPITPMLYRMN